MKKTLHHHQSLKHIKKLILTNIPPTEVCRTIINRLVYTIRDIYYVMDTHTHTHTHYVTHSERKDIACM
jgi:hypothetical protein